MNLSLALSYKEREPEYICYVEKASISPFPRREGGWGVRFFQFASSILAGKGAGGLGFPSSPAVSYVCVSDCKFVNEYACCSPIDTVWCSPVNDTSSQKM